MKKFENMKMILDSQFEKITINVENKIEELKKQIKKLENDITELQKENIKIITEQEKNINDIFEKEKKIKNAKQIGNKEDLEIQKLNTELTNLVANTDNLIKEFENEKDNYKKIENDETDETDEKKALDFCSKYDAIANILTHIIAISNKIWKLIDVQEALRTTVKRDSSEYSLLSQKIDNNKKILKDINEKIRPEQVKKNKKIDTDEISDLIFKLETKFKTKPKQLNNDAPKLPQQNEAQPQLSISNKIKPQTEIKKDTSQIKLK